jgi:hypothetical protein
MKYVVRIQEILEKDTSVWSDSEQNALDAVRTNYFNGSLVLDASNHVSTDFTIKKEMEGDCEMEEEKNTPINVKLHGEILDEIRELYKKKNHDYGDSFHQTFIEEGYAMARIRLSDKLNRFKTLSRIKGEGAKVKDESMRDTLIDLANYAIMTIVEMERMKTDERD